MHHLPEGLEGRAGSGSALGLEWVPRADSGVEQRGGIDVRVAGELQYQEFVRQYLEPGRPLIISGVAQGWRAAEEWVGQAGKVDVDFLEHAFGASRVAVTDTARHHGGAGPCQEMTLAQYCCWWRAHKVQHAQHASHGNDSSAVGDGKRGPGPTARDDSGTHHQTEALLYLKDWHFASEWPQYRAYTCPHYFLDDWLNEWLDGCAADPATSNGSSGSAGSGSDAGADHILMIDGSPAAVTTRDYRFVYWGPAGSSTPLHADVLRSHSWSANLAGRKRWRLVPPEAGPLLHDRTRRQVAAHFFVDVEAGASADKAAHFPRLAQARQQMMEVVQLPGEAIFVPSGWWHTVENLDDCLSINHNSISRHSVPATWAHLQEERAGAAAAIEDCRELCSPWEFEALVQRNTAANCGLDYFGWGQLLRYVATDAMRALQAAHSQQLGGLAHLAPSEARAETVARLQAAHAALHHLWREQAGTACVAAASNYSPVMDTEEEEKLLQASSANLSCMEDIRKALQEAGAALLLAPEPFSPLTPASSLGTAIILTPTLLQQQRLHLVN